MVISDKNTTEQTTDKKKMMKDAIQRLTYPFERSIRGELRDVLIAFRSNVNIALSLLNMCMPHISVVSINTNY